MYHLYTLQKSVTTLAMWGCLIGLVVGAWLAGRRGETSTWAGVAHLLIGGTVGTLAGCILGAVSV